MDAAAGQLGEHLAGVAEQADRQADALVGGLADAGDGVVDVGGHLVQVAGLEAAGDAVRVDLDVEAGGTGQGGGQRLRAAHAAQAGGEDGAAGQVGRAPVALTGGGEGLEGALQDALGADVDPRAGGHLAEHGQAQGLEPAELVPGGEARHQQRVGDQHARCARVGLEDGDRLAALDEHGLVVLELEQGAHDGAEGVVAAGGAAGAAVDDQAGGILGHLRVEVVAEHAQGGLLVPALAAPLGATRRMHAGEVADERLDFAGQFLRRHRRRLYDRRARSPRPDPGPSRAQSPTRPPSAFRGTAATGVTAAVTGESTLLCCQGWLLEFSESVVEVAGECAFDAAFGFLRGLAVGE